MNTLKIGFAAVMMVFSYNAAAEHYVTTARTNVRVDGSRTAPIISMMPRGVTLINTKFLRHTGSGVDVVKEQAGSTDAAEVDSVTEETPAPPTVKKLQVLEVTGKPLIDQVEAPAAEDLAPAYQSVVTAVPPKAKVEVKSEGWLNGNRVTGLELIALLIGGWMFAIFKYASQLSAATDKIAAMVNVRDLMARFSSKPEAVEVAVAEPVKEVSVIELELADLDDNYTLSDSLNQEVVEEVEPEVVAAKPILSLVPAVDGRAPKDRLSSMMRENYLSHQQAAMLVTEFSGKTVGAQEVMGWLADDGSMTQCQEWVAVALYAAIKAGAVESMMKAA